MEFNQIYTLITPAGTISDAGIREILTLIQSQNLTTEEWRALNPTCPFGFLHQLPETWDWAWMVQRGEYAGSFSKRVRSYYYKTQNIKCPEGFIQKIGEIARAHSAEPVVYRFEFVTEFDWEDGDFGDGGSCYWGSNEGAREMLTDNGASAVRFYNDSDDGIGRAWLYERADSVYILWNGYGFEQATLTIAKVVAAFFNLTYKRIHLTNHGYAGGVLYINAGAGYVIGATDAVGSISKYDFGWTEIEILNCYRCGDRVNDDDRYIGADDNDYCQDCYYDLFTSCEHCGETYWQEDTTYVENHGEYCADCLGDLFKLCKSCLDYVRNEDAIETENGVYCPDCYSELNQSE